MPSLAPAPNPTHQRPHVVVTDRAVKPKGKAQDRKERREEVKANLEAPKVIPPANGEEDLTGDPEENDHERDDKSELERRRAVRADGIRPVTAVQERAVKVDGNEVKRCRHLVASRERRMEGGKERRQGRREKSLSQFQLLKMSKTSNSRSTGASSRLPRRRDKVARRPPATCDYGHFEARFFSAGVGGGEGSCGEGEGGVRRAGVPGKGKFLPLPFLCLHPSACTNDPIGNRKKTPGSKDLKL